LNIIEITIICQSMAVFPSLIPALLRACGVVHLLVLASWGIWGTDGTIVGMHTCYIYIYISIYI